MPLIVRLAIVFAAGAIAGSFLPHLPELLFLLAILAFRRNEHTYLIAVAVIGIVAAGAKTRVQEQQCPPMIDRAPVTIKGTALSASSDAQRSIQLKVKGFCKGYVRVRMPDDAAHVKIGDQLEVKGKWMQLRVTHANDASTEGMIIATSAQTSPYPQRGMLGMRGKAQERLHELFPKAYPLAEALLIAQRENINPDIKEAFANSGLTHLLAISGSHVAIVAATLLLLANLLRMPKHAATMTSIIGSTAYVLFLGAPYAALRALLQMTLVLASRSLQRPAHPLGLLAGAAIFITALDPDAPLDAGFQLSFAGIFGIVMWRRPLIDLMPASLPVVLRDAIATTCAATATTTPIAAFHFGTVSVISVFANLLAGPVVAIAVPVTAVALVISSLSMETAQFIAGGAELTLFWLAAIADKCARVPGGHFLVTPTTVITSTIAVGLAFHLRRNLILCALAGALPLVVSPLIPTSITSPHLLQIHMIDVGQGDAFAIRSPAGRWILVDAGPATDRMNAGKRQVVPFLLHHQADQLAAVILSHPHLDHFGGLTAIAAAIPVRTVLDPGMAVPGAAYDSLLAAVSGHGIDVLHARTGARLELDGVMIEMLGPSAVPLDASADPNEFSAAFRLSYGAFSALFMGDMPAETETELVRRYRQRLDVDLLKVGHHGSGGSSSPELLLAATPKLALVSAGRRNRYGHPHQAVLERLEHVGARIFRTDRDGNVSVVVDSKGVMSVRVRE